MLAVRDPVTHAACSGSCSGSLAFGTPELDGLGVEVSGLLTRTLPSQTAVALVHGDYRIGNTLLDLGGGTPSIAAVVDWELSHLDLPYGLAGRP